MSIIYSYPTTQPTLDDLLIGTDVADENATKSFSVQSLVSLINAESGSGTVTDVSISNTDGFLYAKKDSDSPVIAWNINLTNNGTSPSDTKFYRGDGKWAVPVLSGIEVYGGNFRVTDSVSEFKFTGTGVITSSDSSGNVVVNVPGAVNAIESIIQGNGISVNNLDGNVTITNSGITGLINGGGVGITQDTNGVATLTVTAPTAGTVTSVTSGAGISITGETAVSPVVEISYAGASNMILSGVDAAAALPADTILFNQATSSDIKSTTFGEIQSSTLSLIDTSITSANADTLKNTYDRSQQGALPNNRTIGAPPAVQVVTLSAAEFTTLQTQGGVIDNYLYLTTAAEIPPNTVNFTVTIAITDSSGCGYNVTTLLNGVTLGGANPTSVTGAPGTPYRLESTVTGFGSCTYSGPNPVILEDNIPSGSTITVNQTVSGTLSAAVVNPGYANSPAPTATITSSGNIVGTPYTISSNAPLQSSTLNSSFNSFNLWQGKATISNTDAVNYYFNSVGTTVVNAVYNPASGTYTSGTTQIPAGQITATLYRKQYNLNYLIDISNIGGTGVLGSQYEITLSDGTTTINITDNAGLSGTFNSFDSSSIVALTATVNVTATGFIASPSLIQVQASVNMNSDKTETLTMPSSSISSGTGTASMTTTLNITKPAGLSDITVTYEQATVGGTGGVYGTATTGGTDTLGTLLSGPNNASISFAISSFTPAPSQFQWAPEPTMVTASGNNPTQIVAGSNTLLTTTTTGTLIQQRQSFSSSCIGDQAAICNRNINCSFYVQKRLSPANTASYPEVGDTVYQFSSGGAYLPAGDYRSNVANVTIPAFSKMTVASNGYVSNIYPNFCIPD